VLNVFNSIGVIIEKKVKLVNFNDVLKQTTKFIILDGAMGTMLQNAGMLAGEYPECYNFTHQELVYKLHKAYLDAGANVILTNTFGANAFKAGAIGHSVKDTIAQAVSIAKKAVLDSSSMDRKSERFIALDIGDLGQLMEPLGTLSFERAYVVFTEIIQAGVNAGVDLIFFETMNDIYELKAGILAAKEHSELPILCSMNFQENGRTLTGTDPETMVYILEGLGVDALGLNCSLEPKKMIPLVHRLLAVASIPVIVKPNAGLPRSIKGRSVSGIDPVEFAEDMKQFARMGAKIVGGCCGTTPEYIAKLFESLQSLSPQFPKPVITQAVVCSATRSVVFDQRTRIIGERINPTSRKLIKQALQEKNLTVLLNEAVQQQDSGADILDVNVGIPEIDEMEMLGKLTKELQAIIETPLQFDSSNYQALEYAVRIYNGRPLINSVNGKTESMAHIFPIMKKYGAMAVALTLDERGLPTSIDDRVQITEKILRAAQKEGISKDRFLVDCLVLTASVQQKEVMDTLHAVQIIKTKFGVKTTLGISNVSFGLPNRPVLNTTYLAMALSFGVDAPICDPLSESNKQIIRSFRVLTNQDQDAKEYIEFYGKTKDLSSSPSKENSTDEKTLAEIILKGLNPLITPKIEQLLPHKTPMEIIDQELLPALEIVGKQYEENKIFLPQLIRAAETVKIGFDLVKKFLRQTQNTMNDASHTDRVIVLATVKGDVHDIGKNIVKVLLENFNFRVIDLGKDVSSEEIATAIKANGARLVGLSALMTTTVENMKNTIEFLHKQSLDCKIMVGGAVLNHSYAQMIHADYYGKSAWDAVTIAKEFFSGA
jgi:5-methyltetrahydrofolate--homocysteine methyltransferase